MPIDVDIIMAFEDADQMLCMLFAHIFHAEIIDYERELDGPPVMLPKTGYGWALPVSFGVQPLFQQFLGNEPRLRQAKEQEKNKEEEDDDADDNDSNDDDDSDEDEGGLDPVLAAERFELLKKLHEKAERSLKRNGRDHASSAKALEALHVYFLHDSW